MIPDPKTRIRGATPEGYSEALYWRITDHPSRSVFLQLVSVPLFLAWGFIFFALAARLGSLPPGAISFNPSRILALLAGVLATLILHELAHGLAMRIFGAAPRYGVILKFGMIYATSPGFAFPRWQFLSIALAPLVSLSLLAILGMSVWAGTAWPALLAVCATINAAGAIGDLWIMTVVLRYPPRAYIMDEQDGVRVFLPKSKEILNG